jgi:hypothetical protein
VPAAKEALGVLVDGAPMAPEDARAFWARFSEHMEANKGDLAGFAAKEGFASVHPSVKDGKAVLLASRTAPQGAYKPVDRDRGGGDERGGGSKSHQGNARRPEPNRGPQPKRSKRRH